MSSLDNKVNLNSLASTYLGFIASNGSVKFRKRINANNNIYTVYCTPADGVVWLGFISVNNGSAYVVGKALLGAVNESVDICTVTYSSSDGAITLTNKVGWGVSYCIIGQPIDILNS